ncbi:ras association domain-containing protein 1 isoform X3 [Amblyraja radiata]|uniref:ras association domain-containing protein 1 isoform X3 n=1 Tax=Amblyraja radiata TaxID=386614 RepID=UPI00140332D9|nr:ras association domain-containing protein 1 isoform X3 [Amblyraja radiata]
MKSVALHIKGRKKAGSGCIAHPPDFPLPANQLQRFAVCVLSNFNGRERERDRERVLAELRQYRGSPESRRESPLLCRDGRMTWTSTSSSGYCSQEEDAEFEQFFTARTSFIKKPRKYKDEYINWEKQVLTRDEIGTKIREYNSQINSDLVMTLNNDGTYTGFIKVQMKLVRPISVSANMKPQSIYDAKKSTASARPQSIKRRTSFYLPKDTVKHLHISSHTKASEVIKALLNKFMVVDNPRKFALFERIEKEDQVYTRKISDDEHPLYLRLLAGPDEKMLSLVLKENETGEVNWDAFSVPELQNFLRILQREEEEHIRQMFGKYARCRQKMQEELANRSPG